MSEQGSSKELSNRFRQRMAEVGDSSDDYGDLLAELERPTPETPAGPVPHGVVYDRPGWVCSICGFWNNIKDRHCAGIHLESDGAALKAVAPLNAFGEIPGEADPRCFGEMEMPPENGGASHDGT